MSNEPHIEVMTGFRSEDRVTNGDNYYYNCDTSYNADGTVNVLSQLGLPAHIAIGKKTWDGHIIKCYDEQVDEYGVWLEDQVKKGNPNVLTALDYIYNLALDKGVILTTSCMPARNITHAHKVKQFIMELAAGVEESVDRVE